MLNCIINVFLCPMDRVEKAVRVLVLLKMKRTLLA